jgi:protein TonB
MTGVPSVQNGKLIALRPGQPRVDFGAGARGRATDPLLASADLHNVVPFMRPRAATHAPEIALPTDAAHLPATGAAHDRLRLMAFAALSLAVHAGLFAAFWRDPVPLASIGEQVISLEIVIGATAPAGVAQAPGENDVQAAATPEPPREPEQPSTVQPQDVPVAPEEKAPEQTAKSETPVEKLVTETPRPNEEKPPEVTRETELALAPPPEEKKPEKAQQPKPIANAAPARERRRIEAPTKEHATEQAKASAPSTAANNVGVGRSDADSNYAGLVSAHLRRHQQYPSEARSRGDQGTATVSFSLDGGGRVTSSNLARGSGIASIDQEVQAMVRRSSPFPAPPSGRAVSFTVPVSFRLN